MATNKTCKHTSLVPLELSFGKISYTSNPFQKVVAWDEYNIMACHRARVVKYLCTYCGAVIDVPLYKKGETHD